MDCRLVSQADETAVLEGKLNGTTGNGIKCRITGMEFDYNDRVDFSDRPSTAIVQNTSHNIF